MISFCPFCIESLPDKLIDGLILCPRCNRIISSCKQNELITAYKILKKNMFPNFKQFKFALQINEEDFQFIIDCYDNECLSVQDFEKKVKAFVKQQRL